MAPVGVDRENTYEDVILSEILFTMGLQLYWKLAQMLLWETLLRF